MSADLVEIRKTKVSIEEIRHEGGPTLDRPLKVGVACAVVRNPFAGRFEPDLMDFMAHLNALGKELSERLVSALGGADLVEAYGKGAIVGEDGELEHGAMWHVAGGWAMREAIGECKAIVPSAKTVGVMGTRLMIPLGHIQAAYVRSHYGTAEMALWDAPRREEILFGLAMATGGRVHERLGGLTVGGITKFDGLQ